MPFTYNFTFKFATYTINEIGRRILHAELNYPIDEIGRHYKERLSDPGYTSLLNKTFTAFERPIPAIYINFEILRFARQIKLQVRIESPIEINVIKLFKGWFIGLPNTSIGLKFLSIKIGISKTFTTAIGNILKFILKIHKNKTFSAALGLQSGIVANIQYIYSEILLKNILLRPAAFLREFKASQALSIIEFSGFYQRTRVLKNSIALAVKDFSTSTKLSTIFTSTIKLFLDKLYSLPFVVTYPNTYIVWPTDDTATLKGYTYCGDPLYVRGFEYGTSSGGPYSFQVYEGVSSLGEFSLSCNNLVQGTTYYYRAFSTNILGTGYGREKYFTTPAVKTAQIKLNAESFNRTVSLSTILTNLVGLSNSFGRKIDLLREFSTQIGLQISQFILRLKASTIFTTIISFIVDVLTHKINTVKYFVNSIDLSNTLEYWSSKIFEFAINLQTNLQKYVAYTRKFVLNIDLIQISKLGHGRTFINLLEQKILEYSRWTVIYRLFNTPIALKNKRNIWVPRFFSNIISLVPLNLKKFDILRGFSLKQALLIRPFDYVSRFLRKFAISISTKSTILKVLQRTKFIYTSLKLKLSLKALRKWTIKKRSIKILGR